MLTGFSFSPSTASGTVTEAVSADFNATALAGSVAGTLEQNGVAVQGAQVILTVGSQSWTTNSNAAGNYSFSGVAPGNGHLEAGKGGLTILSQEVVVTPGVPVEPVGEIDQISLSNPIFSFWNSAWGMINILELVNRNSQAVSSQVILYSPEGEELAQRSVVVPAAGQLDVILNDLEGFVPVSYGAGAAAGKSLGCGANTNSRFREYNPSPPWTPGCIPRRYIPGFTEGEIRTANFTGNTSRHGQRFIIASPTEQRRN